MFTFHPEIEFPKHSLYRYKYLYTVGLLYEYVIRACTISYSHFLRSYAIALLQPINDYSCILLILSYDTFPLRCNLYFNFSIYYIILFYTLDVSTSRLLFLLFSLFLTLGTLCFQFFSLPLICIDTFNKVFVTNYRYQWKQKMVFKVYHRVSFINICSLYFYF